MTEEWRTFPSPFDGYKISNYGRIISPTGRELKPYLQKSMGGRYTHVVCTLKIERKSTYIRKMAGVATEVYRYFGKSYQDGIHVYHKDGDIMNNRIDNLMICRGYTEEATAEQEARIPEIFACVKRGMVWTLTMSLGTPYLRVGGTCLNTERTCRFMRIARGTRNRNF